MHAVDGMMALRNSNCMVMLNGRHRRSTVELSIKKNKTERSSALFCTGYAFLVDGKVNLPDETVYIR